MLLMRACEVLGYPRIPLLLLVQAFLGPRKPRADGHHSNQVPVSNGLVAGSSQANHLARALLHRALHDHHNRCPKLAVSQFVDDLKMYTEGTTRQVVYRFGQETVELFYSLDKLKVDLSPSKCGFVATTHGSALTVCSGWHEKEFGISSTKHARDLGVDVSFGNRSVPFARKRAKRAGIMSVRVRNSAKKHQRTRRLLFKGGGLPQSTYGHQIWGHSTNGHEAPATGCSLGFCRLSSWNVYHHFAFHHQNRAGFSSIRGSHHRVSCLFA